MKTHPPQEKVCHSAKKPTVLDWDPSVGLSEHGSLKEILQTSICLLV